MQRRLDTTETVLTIMGKAHALGADLRERTSRAHAQEALMGTYRELVAPR